MSSITLREADLAIESGNTKAEHTHVSYSQQIHSCYLCFWNRKKAASAQPQASSKDRTTEVLAKALYSKGRTLPYFISEADAALSRCMLLYCTQLAGSRGDVQLLGVLARLLSVSESSQA